MTTESDPVEQPFATDEVLQYTEIGLWSAAVWIPVLYWINGTSVSFDQAVIRTVLIVIVYAGAPLLRWYRWKRKTNSTS